MSDTIKSPAEIYDLSGKVALITGGSRGMGLAMAEAFALAGANVVIASRKFDACKAAADDVVRRTGREALPVAFHAGRWGDAEALADATYKVFGRCDVLVNNAGMSPLYPDLTSVTEELYDKVHAVNARGPFRLCALIGPRMQAGDGGSIVNISASGALCPDASWLPYAMAKAALNAMTIGLAGAWAPKVRANVILPGAFETDISSGWSAEDRAKGAAHNPLQRMGRPHDIVGAALFLASGASSYVNGAQILVDGGGFRTL